MRREIGDNVSPGPLFELALARASDPQTSHAAADKLVMSGRRTRQVDLVVEAVRAFPDCTTRELGNNPQVPMEEHGIGRRMSDAVRQKRIFKSGTRECTVTQNNAATWRIVE